MTTLEHFRRLSHTLESSREAYLTQSQSLRERIGAHSTTIAALESKNQDARKERETLRLLKKERQDLQSPSSVDPLREVEHYLAMHKTDKPVEAVEVKVPAGQTPLACHNNQAEKTNDILAQIQRLQSTPTTDIDVAAKVDAIATPPRIVNGEIVWPKHVVDSNGVPITVVNTPGIIAALHRDELIGVLELARPTEGGMPAADKQRELGTLISHFVKSLRYEAAAAIAAEVAGQRVVRRRHVHPAILLGLNVSPTAAYEWFSKKRGA